MIWLLQLDLEDKVVYFIPGKLLTRRFLLLAYSDGG